ncbi:MAG: DUF503 domain-containing protein [Spirochaetales bacterium]|nr:DUF503 domain-containing protein [Spirochaetales bacterium]
MVVSMVQFIIQLPDITSIKEKRRIVKSLIAKIARKFKLSAAEVDLQDSLTFTQIGAALVSNSSRYGESVMQKVIRFVEDEAPGRLQDVSVYSEMF